MTQVLTQRHGDLFFNAYFFQKGNINQTLVFITEFNI